MLTWFRSYLIGYTYDVIYTEAASFIKQVTFVVPQGSVLGLLLFFLYTANLADTAAKHDVTLYDFADDAQLYIHCDFNSMAISRDVLERYIQAHWSMNVSQLSKSKP